MLVAVSDDDTPARPVQSDADELAAGGRGMALVDTLGPPVGHRPDSPGTTVCLAVSPAVPT